MLSLGAKNEDLFHAFFAGVLAFILFYSGDQISSIKYYSCQKILFIISAAVSGFCICLMAVSFVTGAINENKREEKNDYKYENNAKRFFQISLMDDRKQKFDNHNCNVKKSAKCSLIINLFNYITQFLNFTILMLGSISVIIYTIGVCLG